MHQALKFKILSYPTLIIVLCSAAYSRLLDKTLREITIENLSEKRLQLKLYSNRTPPQNKSISYIFVNQLFTCFGAFTNLVILEFNWDYLYVLLSVRKKTEKCMENNVIGLEV